MSVIKKKVMLLHELVMTQITSWKKKRTWKKQGKGFGYFGEDAVFEKPLYTRKLQYVSVGKNAIIRKGSKIQCDDYFQDVVLHPSMSIGDRVYIGNFFTAFVYGRVTIGEQTIIADHVLIASENHGTDVESNLSFASQPLTVSDVTIGKNCWIGFGGIILPGVTIGDNVIIGAGSVVTRDIPSCSIAVGNPARVIKQWDFATHTWVEYENGDHAENGKCWRGKKI